MSSRRVTEEEIDEENKRVRLSPLIYAAIILQVISIVSHQMTDIQKVRRTEQ